MTPRRECARATIAARNTARPSCGTTTPRAPPQASLSAYQQMLTAAGHGTITTELAQVDDAGAGGNRFYYAEDYHQQYLAKNPNGYCGLGGTRVACPLGVGAQASASGASSAPPASA